MGVGEGGLLAGMKRFPPSTCLARAPSFPIVCVGNLVIGSGVAMGIIRHRCSIGTNEPIRRGPDAVALSGLQYRYQ